MSSTPRPDWVPKNLGFRQASNRGRGSPESRRKREKRRKQRRMAVRLEGKFGSAFLSKYREQDFKLHPRIRLLAVKKEIIEKEAGIKLGKNTIRRVETLNRILGRPLLQIGWNCMNCVEFNKDPRFFDVDHIIRVADGGTDEMENLQILCPSCHKKKTLGIDGFTMQQSFR